MRLPPIAWFCRQATASARRIALRLARGRSPSGLHLGTEIVIACAAWILKVELLELLVKAPNPYYMGGVDEWRTCMPGVP